MEPLIAVDTPLGFRVSVAEPEWRIILAKHPDLIGREEDVATALRAPAEVRRSRRDENVFLFYGAERKRRWVVAVAARRPGDGRLLTAYRTDAIKEGVRVWPA